MTFIECKQLITEDFKRLHKKDTIYNRIICVLNNHSFMITFWYRIGSFLRNKRYVYKFLFYILCFIYKNIQFKTGIQLPLCVKAEGGLLFAHFGGIVINGNAIIGKNCTIMQNVTIGSIRGKGSFLKIGDNVVLSAGCIVLNSSIGNNVIIGANAVVNKDIEDNAVAVGVPAKIVSFEGKRNVDYYL